MTNESIIEIEQLQQQLNKEIKQQQQRNKTNALLLKQSRIVKTNKKVL